MSGQSFSKAVRSFRKRRNLTGAKLGELLGVDQSAISRWELGKGMPDDGVLLRLYALASGEPEEQVFLAAAGSRMGFSSTPAPVRTLLDLEKVKQAMGRRGVPIEITNQNARRVIESELAAILSNESLLTPLFAELVRYWRTMGADPRAHQVFTDLVKYLNVNFVAQRSGPRTAALHAIDRDIEARRAAGARRVMIRCPQTDKEIFTHMTATEKEWKSTDVHDSEVFCSHCMSTHWWNKADGFLGEPV